MNSPYSHLLLDSPFHDAALKSSVKTQMASFKTFRT